MTDTKPFDGKLALVTGASRGIGAATAEALAAAGAHVILTARTAPALEEVEDRIHAAGGAATIAPMDLTETDHIKKLSIRISELQERGEDFARKLKAAEFVLENREKAFQNELHSHAATAAHLREQIRQRKMFVHPMRVEDLLS